MKVITLADVAQLAGVSKTTVSHVINKTRNVEEETRSRVLAAIEKLNYQVNHVARSLAVKQTYSVGLILTDIGNPFYHQAILGVEEIALANGYTVFLFNANYDEDRSRKFIESMVQRRVDGLIFMSIRASERLTDTLREYGIPSVILDIGSRVGENFATVYFDFERGYRQMIEYLYGLGHRSFAFVGGTDDFWSSYNRKFLFLKVLGEYGIDPTFVKIIESNFKIDGGRRALHELLESGHPATAAYCLSDLLALGMLLESEKIGLRIPGELTIVGTDDIELGREHQPSLTTVALPSYDIGTSAMELMLELIGRGGDRLSSKGLSRTMETHLVVRETSGSPEKRSPLA